MPWIEREAREGGVLHLRFARSENGVDWPVRVMSDFPVSPAGMPKAAVHISGRGSVWMYAHVAALAAGVGAAVITVREPELAESIVLCIRSMSVRVEAESSGSP